jgi:hypothetical protein
MPKVIKIAADGTQSEYAGKTTSAGAGDSGEFVALDGSGKIDSTMMPVGIGQDSVIAVAGEALAAGDFVYFNGSGQVMKADADTIAKAAQGYVIVSVSAAANATVYFDDSNTALSSLTPGAIYYLSATAGTVSTTAPTTAGHIVQEVGFASSATNLRVSIKKPVVRV